ncbi:hypothetical protein R1flu_012125 [Riccia fluitans]|uniref:Uncharacterized protein n=1 Tax=Riccia fluitans TaxID=41844 RepID=A0ABD1ZAV3_9MARC
MYHLDKARRPWDLDNHKMNKIEKITSHKVLFNIVPVTNVILDSTKGDGYKVARAGSVILNCEKESKSKDMSDAITNAIPASRDAIVSLQQEEIIITLTDEVHLPDPDAEVPRREPSDLDLDTWRFRKPTEGLEK